MTGIVAALHAVVIMRGYSRICGEISAEMHTGTPRRLREVLGDRALVGRVGVRVEQADADGLDLRGAQLARPRRPSASAVGAATTSPCGVRALGDLEGQSRGTGGAGNSICRSYMS